MFKSSSQLFARAAIIAIAQISTGAAAESFPGFTVDASEFSLAAPTRLEAGSSHLLLRNSGLLDHHVRILRLDAGKSFRDFERAFVDRTALPPWAVDVGGFVPAGPGEETRAVVSLTPGTHVLICIGRLSDGRSMAAKGMYRLVQVQSAPPHNPSSGN